MASVDSDSPKFSLASSQLAVKLQLWAGPVFSSKNTFSIFERWPHQQLTPTASWSHYLQSHYLPITSKPLCSLPITFNQAVHLMMAKDSVPCGLSPYWAPTIPVPLFTKIEIYFVFYCTQAGDWWSQARPGPNTTTDAPPTWTQLPDCWSLSVAVSYWDQDYN